MSAVIAIVGRPNVGKSTLFNRIVGKRVAITSQVAGTTRDRIIQTIKLENLDVLLVDTGGLEDGKKENIEADMQAQARIGIADANIILFVLDASQELTNDDFLAAELLRKSQKEVILVINKCDNRNIEQLAYNFYELGFAEPLTVSAIHNQGTDKIISKCIKTLKKQGFTPKKTSPTDQQKNNLKVSILGRPNAGKSSLVNAFCGKEKVIVSDVAGTTRDSTDTVVQFEEEPVTLIDTAGIRRRGKIEKGIEKYSIIRCINSIERSDVGILLLDYSARIAKQDCHIAQYILNAHKGLIIVVNKCDLMEDPEHDRVHFINLIRRKFSFIPWAAVVFVSALDRKNIHQIFRIAKDIKRERTKRIQTSEFNNFLQKITHKHLPSGKGKQPPKVLYGTQTDINPPQFTIFVNDPEKLHFSYPRYIENQIRKNYGFDGTALEINIKKRINKYNR